MTFNQFAALAAKYRPDAIVHAHGEYGVGQCVGIVFKDLATGVENPAAGHENAANNHENPATGAENHATSHESKVYLFKGSYIDILNALGIKVVRQFDLEDVRERLSRAKEKHGKAGIFSKGRAMDMSREIERLEELMKSYEVL